MAFLLQSENDEIRLRAAKVLCRAKYAPAVRVLEREFQDAQVHYWLARGALQSLRYCPEEALAYVHSLLTFEEADPEVRRIAIEIIGVTADRGGVPSLIQALNDPEFELRYSAATFLAAWTRETTFTVTKEVFKSNESTYVKSLKQWWAEHGYQRVKDPESPMPVPPAPAGP
jgi:hypothetical protein